MKKINCYPKYAYYFNLALSTVFLMLSIIPLAFGIREEIVIKLVWMIVMLTCSIIMFLAFMYSNQRLIICQDYLLLKNGFGVMLKIAISDWFYEIDVLPTYFSWVSRVTKKWICVYSNDCFEKFTSGCSNKKNHKRVQIIFNQDNLKAIDLIVKKRPMDNS